VTVYRDPPKAVLIETGGRLLLTCKIILYEMSVSFNGIFVDYIR
jgi:hypothetical protein